MRHGNGSDGDMEVASVGPRLLENVESCRFDSKQGSFGIMEAVCGDAEDWHAWGAVAGTDPVSWGCHCCSAVADSA
ncbi:hypothetical protein GT037_008500 [Alternaria burnsii]|uniref:Uncharacterized protein n=1 Tax=Alternaria burnsii TaxID=1187904 RepID=A0A8H7B1B5_9PLEO|nr:uncharacterized protein GT037_008500 [Alternaria burnsii]KAF7673177.1 hypothetical protein GT037_008500 [Alternaria burnsii]